jgi:hypothetical protein
VSWRDLKPIPDDRELERPHVSETGSATGGQVMLSFSDPLSREWWAEWLRSKRAYIEFGTWVDERR